jgi:hypothetical protein
MENFAKKIDFESETLQQLREDATFVMQRLIADMIEKGESEGDLTIAMKIKITSDTIPTYENGEYKGKREIQIPTFEHKVKSSVQIRNEKKGVLNSQMALVFDEDDGEYIMTAINDTTQKSILDSDYKNIFGENPPDNVVEGEFKELPGEDQPALPGPQEDTEEPEEPSEEIEDISDEIIGDGNLPFSGDDMDYEEPADEEPPEE